MVLGNKYVNIQCIHKRQSCKSVLFQIMATFTIREQSAYAAAGAVAEEVLSAIRTVVAFGGEEKEAVRWVLSYSPLPPPLPSPPSLPPFFPPPSPYLPPPLPPPSLPSSRYGDHLKKACNVGTKKSFFAGFAVGALFFIVFCTFALGFW